MNDYRDPEHREEFTIWKHFLVDSELDRDRQQISKLVSVYIDPSSLRDELQPIFECLQCAGKNMALGFVFPKTENFVTSMTWD